MHDSSCHQSNPGSGNDAELVKAAIEASSKDAPDSEVCVCVCVYVSVYVCVCRRAHCMRVQVRVFVYARVRRCLCDASGCNVKKVPNVMSNGTFLTMPPDADGLWTNRPGIHMPNVTKVPKYPTSASLG